MRERATDEESSEDLAGRHAIINKLVYILDYLIRSID